MLGSKRVQICSSAHLNRRNRTSSRRTNLQFAPTLFRVGPNLTRDKFANPPASGSWFDPRGEWGGALNLEEARESNYSIVPAAALATERRAGQTPTMLSSPVWARDYRCRTPYGGDELHRRLCQPHAMRHNLMRSETRGADPAAILKLRHRAYRVR